MPTLHWIGKNKVINHHMDVPFRVLEHQYTEPLTPEGELQDNQLIKNGSSGAIIHGDNLDALKALLPEYEGRINCIYIDPPYNTGNEGWVYNDNVNDPKMKKWLGQVVGKEAEDLTRHDKWLCMMYPRLKLLQKLLAENGSIVISIGYQEVFNLFQICKELFASMQIVCVTVQTNGGKPAGGFNYQHEFLILIVPNDFKPNPLSFSGGISRTPWEGLTLATFDKTQRPNQTYPIFVNIENGLFEGVGETLQERFKNGTFKGNFENFEYDFNEAPSGTVAVWPITSKGKDCVWRLIPSRLKGDWEKGYVKISINRSKDSKNKYSIQYLPEGVIKKIEAGTLEVNGTEVGSPTLSFGENKTVGSEIPTIWLEKPFYSVNGTNLINEIFSTKKFNYPKPIELITEIIRSISSPDDIILDSFAGSGTTAHAVLNLNKQDGGNRKFILVEMEDYAETITAERVKRVMKSMSESELSELKNEQNSLCPDNQINTNLAFDYYELGEPLFLEDGNLNESVGIAKIRSYIWYTETQTPLSESGFTELKNEQNLKRKNSDSEYFLGKHNDTAYYFHYLKDEVTTLNHAFLSTMKTKAEQYVIYADNCVLTKAFMTKHHIIFKKIPRDITRF